MPHVRTPFAMPEQMDEEHNDSNCPVCLGIPPELKEQAQLWLSRSDEAKIATYTRFVRERAEELAKLAEKGRTSEVSIAVDRLQGHLDGLSDLAGEAGAGGDGGMASRLSAASEAQAEAQTTLVVTFEDLSVDGRADIDRALEALRQARSRVDAALEALQD